MTTIAGGRPEGYAIEVGPFIEPHSTRGLLLVTYPRRAFLTSVGSVGNRQPRQTKVSHD
jgi:hypothetical protein